MKGAGPACGTAWLVGLVLGGVPAFAATDVEPVAAAALVAVCETCHRPDGAAIPVIHGRPADLLARKLRAAPAQEDATVMHRLAMGLTAAEIDAVASAFAQAPSPAAAAPR